MADQKPWEKYQDSKPWEKYQAKAEPIQPIGPGQAAQTGFESGVALGLRPLIAGLGGAIGGYAGATGFGKEALKTGLQGFKEERQNALEEQKQAAEQHPKIYTAANIAGSIPTAVAALPAVTAGNPATMTGIGRLVQQGQNLAKGGALVGGILGTNKALSEAQSAPEAAKDVLTGTLTGTLTAVPAHLAGQAVASSLQNIAETKAFKAAGAMIKDYRKANNVSEEKINDLGRTMLDNGLVQVGDSVKSIAQKAQELKSTTGQQIGDIYKKVAEELTAPESRIPAEQIAHIQQLGFHPEEQAENMKAIISQSFKGRPGSTQAINKAHQVIDEIALNGNNVLPQDALKIKGEIDTMINWSKKAADLPMDQEALKMVRNYIQDKLNNQVDALASVMPSKSSSELLRLNRLYGDVSEVANMARDRFLRESGNRMFGLTDYEFGGVGALAGLGHGGAVGPIVGGMAAGLANKAARTFGNAAMASTANNLSQGLQSSAAPLMAPAVTNLIKNPREIREKK